jgi:hypothetical protein
LRLARGRSLDACRGRLIAFEVVLVDAERGGEDDTRWSVDLTQVTFHAGDGAGVDAGAGSELKLRLAELLALLAEDLPGGWSVWHVLQHCVLQQCRQDTTRRTADLVAALPHCGQTASMSWRSYITRKLEADFGGNQRAMAREIGLTRFEDISQWVNQGRVPRPETMEKFVEALGDELSAVAAEITTPDDPIEIAITSDKRLSEDQKRTMLQQLEQLRSAGRKQRRVTEKKRTS